jgi:hypothetical protein
MVPRWERFYFITGDTVLRTARQLFALAALPHNLRFYGGWLLLVSTPALPPLFAIGAIADPHLAFRAGAVFLAVSPPYLVYAPPFEDWQILRFLLPGLPFVFVVCAKGVVEIGRAGDHPTRAYEVATIAAILLAGGSYAFLQRQHVFDMAVQEQRYRLERPGIFRLLGDTAADNGGCEPRNQDFNRRLTNG